MKDALKKYEELYHIALDVYRDEQQRAERQKAAAATLISVLTAFIGAYGLFGGRMIEGSLPPLQVLDWLLVINHGMLFIFLVSAWIAVFLVLKAAGFKKIPLNEKMIEVYRTQRLLDIYFAMAKGLQKAHRANRRNTNRRSRILETGYYLTLCSLILLAVLCVLYFVAAWRP